MTRKQAQPLPAWATAGATAWMAPHTYGRSNKFVQVTITRTTATSIFVKSDREGATERRFVDTGWNTWGGHNEHVFMKYGHRGDSWSKPAYLYGADSGVVASGLAANKLTEAYSNAVKVIETFTTSYPLVGREEAALAAKHALEDYLAVVAQAGHDKA